jgi:hypothetical protein
MQDVPLELSAVATFEILPLQMVVGLPEVHP